MPYRKRNAPWTNMLPGKPFIYLAATPAVAVGLLAPVRAQAQSASQVYKKMSEVYSYARSYQGTVVRVQKGKTPDGKSASKTVTIKIIFMAPNKYYVNTVSSVNAGNKSQSSDQTMVSDGKRSFVFSTGRKLYQHQQIPNENMLSSFFALLTPANGFELLPDSTLNSRPVFVLKPSLPLTGTPTDLANAKKIKITVMIDKRNYQFLKMTIENATVNLVQTVSGQTVNGNVPESLFAWTPPVGYKEVKAPATTSSGPKVPH